MNKKLHQTLSIPDCDKDITRLTTFEFDKVWVPLKEWDNFWCGEGKREVVFSGSVGGQGSSVAGCEGCPFHKLGAERAG